MKDSIAAALNTLKGSRLHGKDLKNQRVSEEQLILAGAFNRLARKSRTLGRAFLQGVQKNWQDLRAKGQKNALFQAVDKGVAGLVNEGKVSAAQGEKILRYALGRGNLDKDVVKLNPKKMWLPEKLFNGRFSTNIGRVVETMRNNRNASQQELDALRAKVNGRSSDIPAKPQDEKSSDVKPSSLPAASDIETGPDCMAYYPVSKEDSKAVFIVPAGYADEIERVSIYRQNGELLSALDGAWKGSDGRRHFRSDMTGTELGDSLSFVLHFVDGTEITKTVDSGKDFSCWDYTF